MHPLIAKNITLSAIVSIVLLFSACDSNNKNTGSTPPDGSLGSSGSLTAYIPQVPSSNVQVHFPPPVVSTQDSSIVIRGEVDDATDITQLLINGSAVSSSDQFKTWQIEMPLSVGTNTLVLSQQDAAGDLTEVSTLSVSREDTFISPKFIVADPANNRLLIWDNALKALIAVDQNSGIKTRLSPSSASASNLLESPRGIALDSPRNRVLLYTKKPEVTTEPVSTRIVAVDLISGEQTWVDVEEDTESEILDPSLSLTIEGGTAYIAGMEGVYLNSSAIRVPKLSSGSVALPIGMIYKIDLATGARSTLLRYSSPETDLVLGFVVDMVTSADSELLYVLDYIISIDQYRLYSINKTTGAWINIEILDPSNNTASLKEPKSISLDTDNQTLFVLDSNYVLSMDLETNVFSVLSGNKVPTESDYIVRKAEDMIFDNNLLYVVDDALDYVLSIDPITGIRTQIASVGGDNPNGYLAFASSTDVSFDAETGRVFNVDKALRSLSSVNIANGEKTIISSPALVEADETENYLIYPISSVMNYSKGELFVLDNYNQIPNITTATASAPKLLSINLETSEINTKIFFGSQNVRLFDIALDEINQIVYTLESNYIRKIDLSGEKAVSSFLSHNALPNTNYPFKGIKSMAIDFAHNRLLVSDATQKAIVAVSLETGARSQFSNSGFPGNGGPSFSQPKSIVVDQKRNRALVLDSVKDAIIAVDLETGQRETIAENLVGSANKFYNPQDLEIHPEFDYAVVIDDSSNKLLAVDLLSNQIVTLSR